LKSQLYLIAIEILAVDRSELKPMNVQWKKLLVKATLWLAFEICLNFIGLDEVADYSEFIFERPVIVLSF
jgi:hypothetical protein